MSYLQKSIPAYASIALLLALLASCGPNELNLIASSVGLDDFKSAVDFQSKNNYEEAKKAYQRVLDAQPNDISTRLNLANLYLQTGDNDKAVSNFQNILENEPGNAIASTGLAKSLEKMGKTQEATKIRANLVNGLQVSHSSQPTSEKKSIAKPEFFGKPKTFTYSKTLTYPGELSKNYSEEFQKSGDLKKELKLSITQTSKADILNNMYHYSNDTTVSLSENMLEKPTNQENTTETSLQFKTKVEYEVPMSKFTKFFFTSYPVPLLPDVSTKDGLKDAGKLSPFNTNNLFSTNNSGVESFTDSTSIYTYTNGTPNKTLQSNTYDGYVKLKQDADVEMVSLQEVLNRRVALNRRALTSNEISDQEKYYNNYQAEFNGAMQQFAHENTYYSDVLKSGDIKVIADTNVIDFKKTISEKYKTDASVSRQRADDSFQEQKVNCNIEKGVSKCGFTTTTTRNSDQFGTVSSTSSTKSIMKSSYKGVVFALSPMFKHIRDWTYYGYILKYDYEPIGKMGENIFKEFRYVDDSLFLALNDYNSVNSVNEKLSLEESNALEAYAISLPGSNIKAAAASAASANTACKAESGKLPENYDPEKQMYEGPNSKTVYQLLNNLNKLGISYKLPTSPDLCGDGGTPPDFFSKGLLNGTETTTGANGIPVLKNCQRDYLVAAATLQAYATAGYSRKSGVRSDGKTAEELAIQSSELMMKNLVEAEKLRDSTNKVPNSLYALGITKDCWSQALYP